MTGEERELLDVVIVRRPRRDCHARAGTLHVGLCHMLRHRCCATLSTLATAPQRHDHAQLSHTWRAGDTAGVDYCHADRDQVSESLILAHSGSSLSFPSLARSSRRISGTPLQHLDARNGAGNPFSWRARRQSRSAALFTPIIAMTTQQLQLLDVVESIRRRRTLNANRESFPAAVCRRRRRLTANRVM